MAGQTMSDLYGYTQPYINSATQYAQAGATPISLQQFSPGAVNQYMSPYLQNVLGSTVANINETNAQQQQQLEGNLIAQGAWGGDRSAVAQSELARQQNLANNATIANVANTGYTSALGEFNTQQAMGAQAQLQSAQLAAAAAPTLANLGVYGQQAALQQAQAQYGYGSAEQQQQQAALSTAYQQFLNQQQYPYQQLGWLGGLVSGAASGMGGTTTSSIPQPGTANQVIGGLGMLGSLGSLGSAASSGGGFLSGIGSAVGSAASGIGSGIGDALAGLFAFSDERAKENIRHVGKTHDGQNIYSFTYKGDPNQKTHIGLMAQEVEKRHPEAVGEHNGLKFVDYKAATDEAAGEKHYADGGLATPQNNVAGLSPVAGMSAQNMLPSLPSMNANIKPPQTQQGGKNPNALDTSKLKDAVAGIRSIMGKPQGGLANASNAAAPTNLSGASMSASQDSAPAPQASPSPDDNPATSGIYARGGLVPHYANGGITIPQGMLTQQDLQRDAADLAGSGTGGSDPALYALASANNSSGLTAAMGGVIRKDDGGPIDTQAAPPAAQAPAPAAQAPAVKFDPRSEDLAIRTIASEMSGKSPDEAKGIANVILNRTKSGKWGNDPGSVVLAEGQFEPWADPQGSNYPMNHSPDSPRYQAAVAAWQAAKNGENPVGNAMNFYAPKAQAALGRAAPSWDNGNGVDIGATRFFADQGPSAMNAPGQQAISRALNQAAAPSPAQASASNQPQTQGLIGGAMTPNQLAMFNAFATLAGTPGRFGVGLAAAAHTYADTLMKSSELGAKVPYTQAQTEEAKARAGLTGQQALQASLTKGPTGVVRTTPTPEGGLTMTQVQFPETNQPVTVSPSGQTAFTAAGAPAAGPTVGWAPAAAAPSSPSAAAPQTQQINFASLGGNETPQDKIKIMQDAAQSIKGSAYGSQAEGNFNTYNQLNSQAQTEAQAAAANRTNLASLTSAVTQTPTSGWQSRGAGKELRDQVANYLNTGYHIATGQDLGASGDNLSQEQIINKIGTLQTQGMQKGLGREAGFWLNTLRGAFPSGGMSEQAAKSILAQMIVEPRQTLDRAAVYDQYGKLSNKMGTDAAQVFNRINPPERYVNDKHAIEELLADRNALTVGGKKENLITSLQSGKISQSDFDKIVGAKYGVNNLSRYFIGG
jgi:hypothetical protein